MVLLCFDADAPQASAALDAARRAAGVEDPRLVRVLDVGRDTGVAFVVEEPLTGARTLASVLASGGLPAEEARRIVGEAASALETARVRGLHHQVLTPRSVLRLQTGAVKVRGLATEAALLEAEEGDSAAASRADAVALVALAYAVLTGWWPTTAPDSGLEAAPRVVGGVAAPSELSAGVPADLDLIARQTLNEGKGPLSPGDLAEQIAPWSPSPLLTVLGERPQGRPAPGGRATSDPRLAPGARTEPLQRDPATGGISRGPAGRTRPQEAPARFRPAAARTDSHTDSHTVLGMGVGAAPEAGVAGGTAAVARGVGTAIGAAGAAASTIGGKVGEKVGGLARTAADRAAEKSATRAHRRHTERLGRDPLEGHDVRLSETLEEGDEPIEPVLPLLPGSRAEPLDRDQSKLALLIVGAFVLLAAALGLWGLPKLGGLPASSSTPVVTQTVTAPPTAPAPPQPTPTPPPPPPQPLAIVGARELDPDNGGLQPNRSAALAYDGNPATMWRSSRWYATPDFGGYQKAGLGLVLDLGQQADVHQVAFTLRGASDVTVYVANQPTVAGATEIGKVSGQDGDVSVAVANGGAARGQLVILWFTRLGPDGQGKFRAQVAEVKVS